MSICQLEYVILSDSCMSLCHFSFTRNFLRYKFGMKFLPFERDVKKFFSNGNFFLFLRLNKIFFHHGNTQIPG